MVQWPSVVKYRGDDELVFVKNREMWTSLYEGGGDFGLGDQLIDANGAIYPLHDEANIDVLVSSEKMSLEKVTELVRRHASELGNCCVTKMIFPSFLSAIEGVASIE